MNINSYPNCTVGRQQAMSHRKISFDLLVQKKFGKKQMVENTPNSISTKRDDKFYFGKVDSRARESVFLENEDDRAN